MGLLSNPQTRSQISDFVGKRANLLSFLMFVGGSIWMVALVHPAYNGGVYFSENALLPGLFACYHQNSFCFTCEIRFHILLAIPLCCSQKKCNTSMHNTIKNKTEIGVYLFHNLAFSIEWSNSRSFSNFVPVKPKNLKWLYIICFGD